MVRTRTEFESGGCNQTREAGKLSHHKNESNCVYYLIA